MRAIKLVIPIFTFLFVFSSFDANAWVKSAVQDTKTEKLDLVDLAQMDRKEVEQKLGRKLNLGERIALSIAKKKVKKAQRKAQRAGDGYARTDGLAIAGFVCGIVGLLSFGVLSILAIVFSIIGLNNIRRNPDEIKGRGLATAGLVCGIIGVVFWTSILVIALAGLF